MTLRRAAAIGLVAAVVALDAVEASAQAWRGLGRLDGSVTDAEGEPVAEVAVRAYLPAAAGRTEVTTDEEGEWAIGGLAGGQWELDFTKDGYVARQISVGLSEGVRPRPVRVTLERVVPAVDPNAEIADGLVRAADLMNGGRFAEARAIYLELLDKYPEAHPIHPLVARAYHGDGLIDEAIEHLRTALDADPENAAVNVLLGGILIERGDTAEGRRMLESIEADRISDPAVLVNLGITVLNQGAAAEALPWFDRAVTRSPEYPDAYYFRGVCHLQLGDTAAAVADLERFVSLAPDAPEADAARGILEGLR